MTVIMPASASPFGVELDLDDILPSIPLALTDDERPVTLSHTFWDACSEEQS